MSQGVNLGAIEPGMPVYGVGGEAIGPVEMVDGSSIRVLNHTVPATAIGRIDTAGVHLHLGYAAFATGDPETKSTAAAPAAGERGVRADRQVVPVAEERLVVGTREVQIGEAKVTKRVVEEQVMVPIIVRREEIEIIRRGPGEPREEIDDPSVIEVIRIPLRGEEPVITTKAVVTREIVINRAVRHEERQITDTVRSTEVRVEEHLDDAYARLRPAFEEDFARRQGLLREFGGATFRAREFREAEQNYRTGFFAGRDRRYADRSFEEIEPELRRSGASPGGEPGLLEQIRQEVRAGFARGRAHDVR